MAKFEERPTISVDVRMTLSEGEARALEAIAGYGAEAFLKVFYEKAGRAYLQPHEAGLRSLFEAVRAHVPDILARTNSARRVFVGEWEAKPKADA